MQDIRAILRRSSVAFLIQAVIRLWANRLFLFGLVQIKSHPLCFVVGIRSLPMEDSWLRVVNEHALQFHFEESDIPTFLIMQRTLGETQALSLTPAQ
jgi:hypothetical protein